MIHSPCCEYLRGKQNPMTNPASGNTNAQIHPIGTHTDLSDPTIGTGRPGATWPVHVRPSQYRWAPATSGCGCQPAGASAGGACSLMHLTVRRGPGAGVTAEPGVWHTNAARAERNLKGGRFRLSAWPRPAFPS